MLIQCVIVRKYNDIWFFIFYTHNVLTFPDRSFFFAVNSCYLVWYSSKERRENRENRRDVATEKPFLVKFFALKKISERERDAESLEPKNRSSLQVEVLVLVRINKVAYVLVLISIVQGLLPPQGGLCEHLDDAWYSSTSTIFFCNRNGTSEDLFF